MSGRLRVAIVAAVTVVVSVAVVVGIMISIQEPDYVIALMGLWAILGAVIVVLRPENAIGWLFLVVGVVWTTGLTATASAQHLDPGAALTFCSWLSEWFWILGFALMISTLFLFPTGRLLSRAWRPVLGLFLLAALALVVLAALEEELQASDTAPIVENPVGVEGLQDLEAYFGGGIALVILGGAIAAAASLVARFRRGDAVERQQLELVALATPVAVVSAVLAGIAEGTSFQPLFWGVALTAIPLAVSVAILRYRLFDVDLLVSRTLVYGLLTVLLGAAYVGLVLAGQAVFSSLAGGGDLAIAASTLVVAALFLPLRARVQRFVDRRFFRRRYDAARTLEAFGARLRDQTAVETLTDDLRLVVNETMHPAHLSIWIRRTAR